jgi:hypothetical protein
MFLSRLVPAAAAALALACPSPAAAGLFAPDSVWDAPLAAAAPLDGDSGALVSELRRQVALPGGVWINSSSYSVPVYTVPAGQPAVHVTVDRGYAPLQRDLDAVPIPPGARPAAGSDGHLTVYQPSSDTLWELWVARQASDGWHASWGGRMTNVSRSPGYMPAPMGATATSLPLLGGLIRADELAAGRIDHALALAIPAAKAGSVVWPAQRGDGTASGAGAIPEGTRFRLDPALNIAALDLPPAAAAIARAAQRYGMIVRDQAGAVALYAEDPGPLGANPYSALYGGLWPDRLLARFPWDRLQAVRPDRSAFAGEDSPAEPPVTPAPPVAPAPPAEPPAPVAPVAPAPPSATPAKAPATTPAKKAAPASSKKAKARATAAAKHLARRCAARRKARTAKARASAARACRKLRRA